MVCAIEARTISCSKQHQPRSLLFILPLRTNSGELGPASVARAVAAACDASPCVLLLPAPLEEHCPRHESADNSLDDDIASLAAAVRELRSGRPFRQRHLRARSIFVAALSETPALIHGMLQGRMFDLHFATEARPGTDARQALLQTMGAAHGDQHLQELLVHATENMTLSRLVDLVREAIVAINQRLLTPDGHGMGEDLYEPILEIWHSSLKSAGLSTAAATVMLTLSGSHPAIPAPSMQIPTQRAIQPANSEWEPFFGYHELKTRLYARLLWYYRCPAVLASKNLHQPVGLVLHGGPGTGKTLLARTLPQVAGCQVLQPQIQDLLRAEIGESEQRVRDLFRQARRIAPCMIVLDNMDSLLAPRDRVMEAMQGLVTQLLQILDVLHQDRLAGVSVIVTCQDYRSLDPALLSPHRLGLVRRKKVGGDSSWGGRIL